ncbi:hypothetical protein DAPPUDRAFT_270809 [Daphnia pulex]|uniref:KIF-binding protein n=1 Tax=Daphnia pulex TaxID=6669 RepID=E9I1C0_DAPPU|nr:hypothetical protein DAPPUDRAFT_270809 [Daphnia pulex]|eukprot:EFX62210.1 hypothetical protein DAPPUDRAFT_270809 [Daphnia pulex]
MSVDKLNHLLKAWEVFDKHFEVFQTKAEAATVAKPFVDKLIRLAEVASQSKDYTSVIEELQKCLEIQKASFPADSRILAKTYYQLGVVFTFTTEVKEAVCCFESVLSVIQLRIQNLKNPTKKKPSMEKRDIFYTTESEIGDLETLLPHVRDKIAEAAITSSNADAANGSMKSVSSGHFMLLSAALATTLPKPSFIRTRHFRRSPTCFLYWPSTKI